MNRHRIVMVCGIGASLGLALWMLDKRTALLFAVSFIMICIMFGAIFMLGTRLEQ